VTGVQTCALPILFWQESYHRNGRRYSSYFALENIADVAGAQNAISRMEK